MESAASKAQSNIEELLKNGPPKSAPPTPPSQRYLDKIFQKVKTFFDLDCKHFLCQICSICEPQKCDASTDTINPAQEASSSYNYFFMIHNNIF